MAKKRVVKTEELFNRPPDEPVAEAEAWRDRPIAGIPGFSDKHIALLDDQCIDTAGQLQDRMRKDPEHWHKGIIGIGAAAKVKIEDAFNAFVAEHP